MDCQINRRSMLAGAGAAAAMLSVPVQAAPRRFFDRIGRPIGIQLYALGEEAQKDLAATLRQVAAMGYREIEAPGLMGRTAGEVRKLADDAGLWVSSVHVPASGELSIRSEPQKLADTLGTLGSIHLVVPMFPFPAGFKLNAGEGFAAAIVRAVRDAGPDMWKSLASLLNERAALLKPFGISVGYHNHSVEFTPLGATTGWEILAAETDPALVHFEADIGWLASAGVDPVQFFDRYSGRCRQVHVKDVQRGFKASTAMLTAPAEIGAGSVDWARVLPAAYAAGVRHFYYEQEPPFSIPRMRAAQLSHDFLARLRA